MTLNTRIMVLKPVPVEALFKYCQSLLGNPETQKWEHIEARSVRYTTSNGTEVKHPDHNSYHNAGNQGLPAWLMLDYGTDGPLGGDQCASCTDCPLDARCKPDPVGAIQISFDTAYGYKTDNGAGCADLHASFIVKLVKYLHPLGTAIKWQNEFTGEWFDGTDASAILDFGDPYLGVLK